MTRINRTALVPFSAERLYHLVLDVESYPDFLPWCGGGQVYSQNEQQQDAAVTIRKGPLNTRFRTMNTLTPHSAIQVSLTEGPFRKLKGHWQFTALAEDACKVEMDMQFEFSLGPAGFLLKPVFSEICDSLLQAFVNRAHARYGNNA